VRFQEHVLNEIVELVVATEETQPHARHIG
jgi:hypothetical protein